MDSSEKKNTITIQDIAEHLNVSASTVSRALKNNARISEKTKKEVWQAARELGYQLNTSNYFPDSEQRRNIGVIVPDLTNNLHKGVIKRIQRDVAELGYNVIVMYSLNSPEMEEAAINNCLQLNVSGVVISLIGSNEKPAYIEDLIAQKVPLVCIDSVNFDLPVPKIILDTYQGVYKAVKHLLSVGCKKVALMLGDDGTAKYSEMLNGYKTGLSSSGVAYKKEYVIYNSLKDDVDHALENYFGTIGRPDAIIAADNYSALKTITYLKENNIRVPQDVAVVSFGSDSMHKLYSPSVTSIHYSANDVGKFALSQLMDLIEKKEQNESFFEKSVIAPVRLIIRGSSMR